MSVLIAVIFINLGALQISRKTQMKSSGAYLSCLMSALMVMWVGALTDLLYLTTIGAFLLIAALNLFQIFKYGIKNWISSLKEYMTFTVSLNNISCLIFAAILAVKQPIFYYWDEYSFWGSSAKFVQSTDKLYTIGTTPLFSMRGLPCGNTILNYLFQFFSGDFADYRLLLAYAFMFFAVFAAAAQLIMSKENKIYIGLIAYLAFILSPFVAIYHLPGLDFSSLSYAYGTSMVDFNIPVIALGAIVLFLLDRDEPWYLFAIAFLTTVKNTSIAFSLLCCAIIACLILFSWENREKLYRRAMAVFFLFALPIAVNYGWSHHVARTYPDFVQPKIQVRSAVAQSPSEVEIANKEAEIHSEVEIANKEAEIPSEVDITNKNSIEKEPSAAKGGIISMFVPKYRTDRYKEVLSDMVLNVQLNKITNTVQDKYLIVILVLIGLFTVAIAPKNQKLALLLINGGLAVGCYVYCVGISYFIAGFRDGMVEYQRYMTSYYFTWIYISLLLLLQKTKEKDFTRQAILLLCLIVGANSLKTTGIEYTVIDAPRNAYSYTQEVLDATEFARGVVGKGDRVYLVMPDQDTEGYMYYTYMLYPAFCSTDTKNTGIDFTISFRTELDPNSERQYYNIASKEDFAKIMGEYFDYVFVVNPDEEFVQGYEELFSGGIKRGELYKIVPDGDLPMQAVTV